MYSRIAVATLAIVACNKPEETGGETDSGETDSGDTDTAVATPTEHCGQITTPETWAPGVHDVTCYVYVEGTTLTLAPGAEVRFAGDTGLYVGYNGGGGQLIAEGTADHPIALHGPLQSGRGTWTGIVIAAATSETRLAELTLRDAGGVYADAAVTVDGGDLRVNHVTIHHVDDAGFHLLNGARFSEGSAGLVVSDAPTPGRINAGSVDSIPLAGLSLADNDDPEVYVDGGDLDHDATWGALGVPYFVQGDVYVDGGVGPATLTLAAGAELVMGSDRGIYVGYKDGAGGLVAAGTQASPVVFRGATAQPGLWSGVFYDDAAVNTKASLSWTEISDAGGAFVEGALFARDMTLRVDHVTIRDSENAGFMLAGTAEFDPASTDLTVTGCEVSGHATPYGAASIPEAGAYVGNDLDAVVIEGDSTLRESATWGDLGVPYQILTDLYVQSTTGVPPVLTVQPGAVLAFGAARGLYVGYGYPGGLLAGGSASAPVVITGIVHQPGSWSGVFLADDVVDASTVLSYVDVGYGGGEFSDANVTVTGSSPTLRNVNLHDSEGWGLTLHSGDPTVEQVTYVNNASGDLHDLR